MRAVLFTPPPFAPWGPYLDDIAQQAKAAAGSIPESLALARSLSDSAPRPGAGNTRGVWELLATVASVDLTAARVLEPHLDALAIREQAGLPLDRDSTWGVYAAEGAGVRVTATRSASGWQLEGTKPWCSLAGELDHALITAFTSDSTRRLFAINLRDAGITVTTGNWAARGLTEVRSEDLELQGVIATPVGADGWYLTRSGFAWGGMGVAAVWYGASVALGRALRERLMEREPDPIALMQLGEVDMLLHSCRMVLTDAALAIDVDALLPTVPPAVMGQRVRSTVSAAAERIMQIVGHALGPAPLALDEDHARRVADLQLYVRQDHAERDLARLGSKVLELDETPW